MFFNDSVEARPTFQAFNHSKYSKGDGIVISIMGCILVSFKEAKLGPSSGSKEAEGDNNSDGDGGERSGTPVTLPSNCCQCPARKQPGSLKKHPRLAAQGASTTPFSPISTDMDLQQQGVRPVGSHHFQQLLSGWTLQGDSVVGVPPFSSSSGAMPPVSDGLGFDNWPSFTYDPTTSDLQGALALDFSMEMSNFFQGSEFL